VPALEALQARFYETNTQPLGISVDSVHCHSGWAASLGGISYPLLADFHPKGAVASSFGVYLEDDGITDRATVIIDADGIVRHISSVTPAGERDISELAALCEQVEREHPAAGAKAAERGALGDELVLYFKPTCGFSQRVLRARENLHLTDRITLRDLNADPSAAGELQKITGKTQVPCLVIDGVPRLESADIIAYLVERAPG
jgi:glutaredoxin